MCGGFLSAFQQTVTKGFQIPMRRWNAEPRVHTRNASGVREGSGRLRIAKVMKRVTPFDSTEPERFKAVAPRLARL
jgi:hypothetical protein